MRKSTPKALSVLAWGALFPILIVLAYLYPPTFIQFFDNRIYDWLLSHRVPVAAETLPVVIDVDERTLDRFGQWPWPRYRMALLLEKVNRLGASAVAVDVIFSEPDRTALSVLQSEAARDLGIQLEFDGIPDLLINADEHLAKVMADGYFVLSTKLLFGQKGTDGRDCMLHPVNTAALTADGGRDPARAFYAATDAVCILDVLAEASAASGFTNARPDDDGMIRRIPLLIRYRDGFYPSLALAAVMRAMDLGQVILREDPSQGLILGAGPMRIPIDGKGNLLVNFRSSRMQFERISGADIMDGKIRAGSLKGRIAFLGTSVAGIEAYHATPVDSILSGVEIHAAVADNLLKGDFLSSPQWPRALGLILIVAAGVISALLLSWSSPIRGALLLALLAAGVSCGSAAVFWRQGVFVTPVYVLLAIGANFSFLNLVKFVQREKEIRDKDRELILVQETTIDCMATLAEYRDPETGGHIRRTQKYVDLLAQRLKRHPRFEPYLSEETLYLLSKSAPLHDIGKIGVRDDVLLKAGGFDAREWEEMKKHTVMGYQAINRSVRRLGKNSFLELAAEIAHTHQEKWDGSGYPRGLKGEEIPVSGRLMALGDVYDALISRRVYKAPMTHSEAVGIIQQGRGVHFDPDVVDAFLDLAEEFRQTAIQFADTEEQRRMLTSGKPSATEAPAKQQLPGS